MGIAFTDLPVRFCHIDLAFRFLKLLLFSFVLIHCFYVALQPNLYPTVGLQTPGEVVDANFGQAPFVFDIEDMMKELRARTRLSILNYSVPETPGDWQAVLHKYVYTFINAYCVKT